VEHREPAGADEQEARRLLRRRLKEVAAHEVTGRPFYGRRLEKLTVLEVLAQAERDAEVRGLRSQRALRSSLRHLRAGVSDSTWSGQKPARRCRTRLRNAR